MCNSTYTSMMMEPLRVQLVHQDAKAPQRMSSGAAGYDLCSCEDVIVPARGIARVSTGVCIAIPTDTYARIAPRSGLACKGIDVGAGVVDSDYRAPICVILYNHADIDMTFKSGDRVAQLILEVIKTPDVEIVDSLDCTDRGTRGFGSTGLQ